MARNVYCCHFTSNVRDSWKFPTQERPNDATVQRYQQSFEHHQTPWRPQFFSARFHWNVESQNPKRDNKLDVKTGNMMWAKMYFHHHRCLPVPNDLGEEKNWAKQFSKVDCEESDKKEFGEGRKKDFFWNCQGRCYDSPPMKQIIPRNRDCFSLII